MVALVSVSNGVEARIQTPPFRSLMAVDLPPTGNRPNLANGLEPAKEAQNYVCFSEEVDSLTLRTSIRLSSPKAKEIRLV